MNWPDSLKAELASRRCIVFLGAGASSGCISTSLNTNPPTWKSMLESLENKMSNRNNSLFVKELIKKEKYLEAAEIIKEEISPGDFTAFMRDTFVVPRFKHSKIHEFILELDPKIVITTNYDEIYDNYCRMIGNNAYNVSRYYDDHLISDLKSTIRVIIKAHGCISNPSKTILTKSDYFKARQQYSNFFKILDALFLTHTILFIGYSLSDPDIQLTLENVNITAPNSHPHYFVAESGINIVLKKSYKNIYNLEFIEFPSRNFSQLEDGINELVSYVTNLRENNPAL